MNSRVPRAYSSVSICKKNEALVTSTELRISFQSKQKEGGGWKLCRFRPTKVCLAWRIYRNQRWSFWSAMTRKRHHDHHFEEKNTQVTAEDDVIIKVGFAGLCGTDLHIVSVCLCFWTQQCQFKQQYKKILKDQSNENIVNNCNLGSIENFLRKYLFTY